MVVILGATDDDILYFRTKMDVERVDRIGGRHEVYVGVYSGKDVAVTTVGLSSTLSAMYTGLCLEKYAPYVVICVGSVQSIASDLKQGNIFISDRVYPAEVDFTPWGENNKYGQIPGMPVFFTSENDYLIHVETIAKKLTSQPVIRGFALAPNRFITDRQEALKLLDEHFASIDGIDAVDPAIGGVVATCKAFDIPWIAVKAVNYEIGHDDQLLSFIRKGLESAPLLGEIVTTLFLELSAGE